MTKRISAAAVGVFLLSIMIYAGYGYHDIFRSCIDLLGIFSYAFAAVVVFITDKPGKGSFFGVLAPALIPVAAFNVIFYFSLAETGLWPAVRTFEMLLLIFAAACAGSSINKNIAYLVFIMAGIGMVFAAPALRILPEMALLGSGAKSAWASALFLAAATAAMLLRHNRRNFDKNTYLCLVFYITSMTVGNIMYIFLFDTAGHPAVFMYIMKGAAWYLLLRAVTGGAMKRSAYRADEEPVSARRYFTRLLKYIKMGMIILSFSDDLQSVCIKDLNDYAAKYFGIDIKNIPRDMIPVSSLEPAFAEAAGYAADNYGNTSGKGRMRKLKIIRNERCLMAYIHPYFGSAVLIMFEDITREIMREQKIRFLVLHDSLTKLYNRNYIAEAEKMFGKSTLYPIAVIVGDVNGLKATNDIFGHSEGDRLLCETASIIRNSAGSGDICIRYGGDEFLVIAFNCDAAKAEEFIDLVGKRLHGSTVLDFTPSVSFGYSIMNEKGILNDHIDAADRMMYVKKNEDEMNIQKGILRSLLKTLRFKDIESEEHLNNVSRISLMIGKNMDLSNEELEELSLISLLHDIGKINITIDILKKSGTLTEEEWEKVRKHSMDGYNMTESIKEFKGVSKYILFHHEQWDGRGYPHGLKGDSIPVLSRIVALADAYDSMTRDRPYKKRMSRDAAMLEIYNNKGKQFDPDIVDIFLDICDKIC